MICIVLLQKNKEKKSRVSRSASSWKNGSTMNSQQTMEAILAMDSGSNLSSITCTALKNWQEMKIPVREIFLKIHLWLSYLVSEIKISSFCTITVRQDLCVLVKSSVLTFCLSCCHILLENCVSFSLLIHTFVYWSLTCLELHRNF